MVHYRDDFHFGLLLFDINRAEIGWPDFDWELRIRSEGGPGEYRAGVRNGEAYNCRAVCGRIVVDCVNHGLRPGLLEMEFGAEFVSAMSGRVEKLHHAEMDPGIFLTVGRSEPPRHVDIDVLLPLLRGEKGDPLVYEDLTDDQKQELADKVEILELTDDDIYDAAGCDPGEIDSGPYSDEEIEAAAREVFRYPAAETVGQDQKGEEPAAGFAFPSAEAAGLSQKRDQAASCAR